jgi:hypothetical protein
LRLIQFQSKDGTRSVAAADEAGVTRLVAGVERTYSLATMAIAARSTLAAIVGPRLAEKIDLESIQAEGRLLPPIDHEDSAHLYLSGTGLTHLGSAASRDKMHKTAAADLTDSMRMFRMGVEGGKPYGESVGVQPEWFYKGDGSSLVASGQAIHAPAFALDGSEEPEIAGIYLVDSTGTPHRLGYCLANEFSDHIMERGNYLWLAHSKLRPAALGAELLTGPLPSDIRGTSRVLRAGTTIWEKPFLTGEANMSHYLSNLEHHHFKHALFRRPGDVHVHFFGTATLSFADGVVTQPGDVFEIEAPPFQIPLQNRLERAAEVTVPIRAL